MTYAGTGHRPDKLGGYGMTEIAVPLIREFLKHKACDCSHVLSGMALGFDQYLALAAYSLKIPFTAVIPFRGQENKWPEPSKLAYRALLNAANRVVYVSDPGYTAAKMHLRNEWLVNNCDKIVTLWNGSTGGTSACLSYNDKKDKKPVYNLWDVYKIL